VANAGSDQTVQPGARVTLSGAKSTDPDASISFYAWQQTSGPAVTLTGANSVIATFTAPSRKGTLTFQLTVTDQFGLTATDNVTITVGSTRTDN
jgi:chitinase